MRARARAPAAEDASRQAPGHRARLSCPRCPSRCPSPRSRPTCGRIATTSTRSWRGSPTSSRHAGTGCSWSPRRPRARSCATRARRCATGALEPRPARRASSPSARRCRRCPAGAARRCRSTSRARSPISSSAPPSTSATCTSRSRPAWPAPRCATRARSTSAPSTRRPSASWPPRWRARSCSSSSGASTRAPPPTGRPRSCCAASSRATTRSSRPAPTPRRARRRDGDERVRIAFVEEEERGALRVFLRALRRLDPALPWDAVVHSERGPSSSTPLRADLLERVRFVDDAQEALAGADVLVAASDGVAPAPGLIARAQAAGAVPVASRLAVYEELLASGEARAALRAQRHRDARRAARPPGGRRRPARAPAGRRAPAAVERRGRRARGPVPNARRAPPRRARRRRRRAGAQGPAHHRRRPAHAHRPQLTTAPRRSRCCWPPRATRGWARSR